MAGAASIETTMIGRMKMTSSSRKMPHLHHSKHLHLPHLPGSDEQKEEDLKETAFEAHRVGRLGLVQDLWYQCEERHS